MIGSGSEQSGSRNLTIELVKDTFRLHRGGQAIELSQKWGVFYTLLAVNSDRHISTDEVCDHHPWSRLSPEIAGRDLWRFMRSQEIRFFGERITSSPARQATKLFTLLPECSRGLSFAPDRPTVADHLRSLRQHRNAVAMEISECTLMMQSGLIDQSLERLRLLKSKGVNVNDLAHIETLITMCLDEYQGINGTAAQVPVLQDLLEMAGLARLNRARVLIRLARHATLSANYEEARQLYTTLRPMLSPEDGVEYCWYHINYGLYLRRVGRLDEAMYHQRLAHDVAQIAQWWHGVYSARYNLALMHLTAADQSPPLSQSRHLQTALDWAMKAYSTVVLTRQAIAMADTSMLITLIQRRLKRYEEARHWLRHAQYLTPEHPDHYPNVTVIYGELAKIEEASGNFVLAYMARERMQRSP